MTIAGLPYRGSTAIVTEALVQAINTAYRERGPAVATIAALRAIGAFGADGSVALIKNSLRYVTAEATCFRWDGDATAADDGADVIAPTGAGTRAGRWRRCATGTDGSDPLRYQDETGTPIEAGQTGYLRAVEIYAGERDRDEFEKRIYGQRPCVVVDFLGRSKERKSTTTGGLAWATFRYEVNCVSFCARPEELGFAGSPVPDEAALDPGAWVMAEDLETLLDGALGEQLGVPAISHVAIGDLEIVERDLAGRLAIVSLALEVKATLGRGDADSVELASVYAQTEVAIARPAGAPLDRDNVLVTGIRILPGLGLSRAPTDGSARVGGELVTVAGAVAFNFDADADTYRDLDSDGVLTYTAVAVGAEAPELAEGSLRIGRTRTDSSSVLVDTILAPVLRAEGAPQRIYP